MAARVYVLQTGRQVGYLAVHKWGFDSFPLHETKGGYHDTLDLEFHR